MKIKEKVKQKDDGITLIALIITIIVLVILAAVTLNSIFESNIIGLATNGAIDYAEGQQEELGVLNSVSELLESTTGGNTNNPATPTMPTINLSGTQGENGIYIDNVTIEIGNNAGEGSNIHYVLTGAQTQEEQVVEGENTSVIIDQEGTTTATIWIEDKNGNQSEKTEVTVTIDKTQPSQPTITLNGTQGENAYYKSDVQVTINAGTVGTSGVSGIRYYVEGANPIAETEITGTTETFNITAEGTSTIIAFIKNNAGVESKAVAEIVSIDRVEPSTGEITVGTVTESSIEVIANGVDSTSGIASYEFQYSTTNEAESFKTDGNVVYSNEGTCSHTYQNLTAGTTYYLRVIVKDRAGNIKISNVVPQELAKEEIIFAELTETEKNEMVGQYIDYTPETGTYNEHTNSTYSGSSSNSSMSTITTLKWRILEATNTTLTLVSDTTANTMYLKGANGYNNGVKLLNDACETMYSNEKLGATGRSMNKEDVENHASYSGATLNEGFLSSSYRYYPAIYAQEKTGAPNGSYGTKLDLSEQDQYYTGRLTGNSSYRGRGTGYYRTMSTSNIDSAYYLELFRYQPGTTTNFSTGYWLASRGTDWNTVNGSTTTSNFGFDLFMVDSGSIGIISLFYASGDEREESYALRPIVEIDLSKVSIGQFGNGTSGNPHSIREKI